MAIGCVPKTAKFLLFVFNILVFFAGVALFAVGIWVLVDDSARHYVDIVKSPESEDTLRAASIIIIVLGAVTAAISFCGCCGAWKESSCLLITYAVVLSLILIVQVAAGVTAAVFKSEIEENLENTMNDTVQNKYGTENNTEVTDAWDYMQVDLKCCGVKGTKDWLTSTWYTQQNGTKHPVPVTCCKLKNSDPNKPEPVDVDKCYEEAEKGTGSTYLHTKGCETALADFVRSNADVIIGTAFGLTILLLLGVFLACCLHRNKNSDYETV